MEPFTGFEPQVGEILALRTFRVGPGGVLYPLFSGTPWSDGDNTAHCRIMRSEPEVRELHEVPDSGCSCGFYAYGTERAAAEYPHARHVLAVVACWGRVIAGTRGLRAECCRVEALWLSDAVPAELVAAVGRRYRSVVVYRDKAAMLSEYPLTVMDCYELAQPRSTAARRWLAAAVGCAVLISALPAGWWHDGEQARAAWAVALAFVLLVGWVVGRGRAGDVSVQRRRLLFRAVALWIGASFLGPIAGWLLRIPLLQLTALFFIQRWQLRRAGNRFPAAIG